MQERVRLVSALMLSTTLLRTCLLKLLWVSGICRSIFWRLGKKSPDAEKGQSLDEKILEDLKKSAWYLNDAIGQMEKKIKK